jgi:Pyruvate/2-oxoacid:ferredoxin oxidoreductase delta subunit
MQIGKKHLVAKVDAQICTGCQSCQNTCPTRCITSVPGVRLEFAPTICHVDVDRCVGCTMCNRICPSHCIEMVATSQCDRLRAV